MHDSLTARPVSVRPLVLRFSSLFSSTVELISFSSAHLAVRTYSQAIEFLHRPVEKGARRQRAGFLAERQKSRAGRERGGGHGAYQ